MLKVYFTASTSANGEFSNQYKKIISMIKRLGCLLTSGEQIVQKNLLERDRELDYKTIFEREKSNIDRSDLIVAEVTKPSTGVGGEIVYALTKNKPVLALVYKENEDKLSPMVAGNPSENLFLEHYEIDNIHLVLKDYITHISIVKGRKGKLIVVDGGDGSGKTTQAKLLIDYLRNKHFPVKYADFPRYYSSFHGRTVGKFLRGEFGTLDQVSPYLASLAYALDRASMKVEMEEFLNKGGFIIANRYATSNMAHQGAKFNDVKKRAEYLKWVYELEYKAHKIPKEDLVIYLFVPWQIGLKLTDGKGKRNYLAGRDNDIAEADIQHRIASEKMYQELASKNKHWVTINCVSSDKLLPPSEIHQMVISTLKTKRLL